jgi:hypothetical protein
MRQRSLSQRLSLDQLKHRPKNSRVASESFVSSGGVFKGQIVGSGKDTATDDSASNVYLNHDDINKRAIQIFHTEGAERGSLSKRSITKWLLQMIHPYDRFRRSFDFATVVFVLILVFFIPLEIGFDWFEALKWQKILFAALDFWFALDIALNFRTGYIHHGTIVMDPNKVAS